LQATTFIAVLSGLVQRMLKFPPDINGDRKSAFSSENGALGEQAAKNLRALKGTLFLLAYSTVSGTILPRSGLLHLKNKKLHKST
jgi:hypothetical protein